MARQRSRGGKMLLEESGDHVDAFGLDVGRLRVLLVVDEVLGLGRASARVAVFNGGKRGGPMLLA